jgi:hypothetical protein
MSIEVLLECNVEKGAKLIYNFINRGWSEELDLDIGRDGAPSTVLMSRIKYLSANRDKADEDKLVSKTKNILSYMIDNYKSDSETEHSSFLNELIWLSIIYRVKSTPSFLKKLKSSDKYNHFNDELKTLIERGIITL